MNTKKLAMIQLILTGITFLFGIIMVVHNGGYSFGYTGAGAIGIICLIAFIATIVVGILQIVDHGNGVALAAGITGVLSFIPLVSLASLILNIIVLAKKS